MCQEIYSVNHLTPSPSHIRHHKHAPSYCNASQIQPPQCRALLHPSLTANPQGTSLRKAGETSPPLLLKVVFPVLAPCFVTIDRRGKVQVRKSVNPLWIVYLVSSSKFETLEWTLETFFSTSEEYWWCTCTVTISKEQVWKPHSHVCLISLSQICNFEMDSWDVVTCDGYRSRWCF